MSPASLSTYHSFLQSKRRMARTTGIDIPLTAIHPRLFPFQQAVVQWILRKGRAALFAGCWLGKSYIQLVWANLVQM
jgi:hypothetical protein